MQNNNNEWLKRCFNCMEPIDSPDAECANCGWDNHNRENGNAALEQTILKDQYIVGKSLGRGGFGITYVGFDLALERRIAIKEFFPIGTAYRFGDAVTVRAYTETEADFQSGLKQALQESRTTAKLGHIPNVMQVHNVFLENGTVYMIMEYIEGISLGDEVKRNGKLNWREALHLLYPIMNALEKIHEKGLIHRDVSPENIIRRKETGEPVLLDFGSARPPKEGLTVMLKPGYAPAEQYSRNSEQDGRVDEYALCATLYYLVTGSAPASADLRMFAKKELKRPSEFADDIPAEFEKVLLKGMELDSSNRYTSMRELHEAFLTAEKEGIAERKGSVGNKAAVSSKGFKKSKDSEDYKDSDDAGHSGNSGNGAGSDNGKKPAGSGSRKPEKEENPRESRKIAGAFVGGVAVACLAGFLLFGNAGRDKDAKKEAAESAVEGSVAEEEETVKATSTPTPTPEPTATNTPTPEPTATNTPTPEPTATNTPTPEPTATNTPTPEPTATNTPTPEPTATNTPTPEPTATNTPTPTSTSPEKSIYAGPPVMRGESDVDSDNRKTATVLGSEILRSEIEEVIIETSLKEAPETAWDVSEAGDGSVLAWISETYRGKRLTIAGEGGVSAPEDSSYLFKYYDNLQEVDLNGLDTKNVTNMQGMFSDCWLLHELDLSTFDTSNVRDMSSMFSGCSDLRNLDVSSFETTNVGNMSAMFSGCKNLKSLDVNNFDTSNVTDMSNMFENCSGLSSIDVSGFDTSNVVDMSYMFSFCTGLSSIDVSNFDTSKAETKGMFNWCLSLPKQPSTSVELPKMRSESMVDNEKTNVSTVFGSEFLRRKITEVRIEDSLTDAPATAWDVSESGDGSVLAWVSEAGGESILTIAGEGGVQAPENSEGLFSGYTNLRKMDLDGLDTSNVTNMKEMFYGCESLTSVDVSKFNTSKVTDMSAMFSLCSGLTSLDVSNFDTSNVTDMSRMFYFCTGLTKLDVSNFDMSKADTSDMFWGVSRDH